MNVVEAEARARALVEAMWTHHSIVCGEIDGRAVVRIMATVPPLRGMTVVAEAHRTSIGRAWRALLPTIEHRAQLEAERLARNADDLEARAKHERATSEKLRALIVGGTP